MAKPSGKYTINGTRGDDTIFGETYSAALQQRGLIINGNAGNDTLKGGSGKDVLNGGDGDDRIIGDLTDLIGVGDGVLAWDGGRGTDTLDLSGIVSDAGKGVWLALGSGPRGSGGFLRTNVEKNDYSLNWSAPGDAHYSSNFRDFELVVMGNGDDIVTLIAGSQTVWGGGGNDYLDGQAGNDTIHGGLGDDMIVGGWGSDRMSGGHGNDVFAIVGRVAGEYTHDVVDDFQTAYDQIWLYPGWSITWDSSSSGVLHGYLNDQGTTFGEITIANLTYADRVSVQVHHVDPSTGVPAATSYSADLFVV